MVRCRGIYWLYEPYILALQVALYFRNAQSELHGVTVTDTDGCGLLTLDCTHQAIIDSTLIKNLIVDLDSNYVHVLIRNTIIHDGEMSNKAIFTSGSNLLTIDNCDFNRNSGGHGVEVNNMYKLTISVTTSFQDYTLSMYLMQQ